MGENWGRVKRLRSSEVYNPSNVTTIPKQYQSFMSDLTARTQTDPCSDFFLSPRPLPTPLSYLQPLNILTYCVAFVQAVITSNTYSTSVAPNQTTVPKTDRTQLLPIGTFSPLQLRVNSGLASLLHGSTEDRLISPIVR